MILHITRVLKMEKSVLMPAPWRFFEVRFGRIRAVSFRGP
jgi:hypothetical protein